MEGFQLTDVGYIPNDWEFGRIDEFFTIQQGKSVSKANRIGNNQKPFLRTSNLLWGKVTIDELDYLHFSAEEEKKFKLEFNDLLVCEGGDIGRTAIWKNELEGCYYQNHLHRVRAKTKDIDPVFVLNWMQYAFNYAKVYFGRGNITTIPNLSKSRLSEFTIPNPPIPEQRKIAYILSTVQKAIEQQDKLIHHTTELKKALMQKLFTEGTKGEKQKQTEIGLVPESWEVVEMQSIVDFKTGKLNSNAANKNGVYPFFTCSQETFRINTYAFDQEAILLSGNNARAIYSVKHYKGKFNAYQRTYVITILDEKEYNYLFLKVALTRQLEYLRTISIGSQTRYLTLGMLTTLLMPKPNLVTQRFIGKAVQQLDNKIELIEAKKQTLTALFKTLLHELMTAERRVHEIEFEALKKEYEINKQPLSMAAEK